MKRRKWWWIIGLALSVATVGMPVQTSMPQVSNAPIIGKHKAPIRFVPMKQARKFYKEFSPSEVPDPRLVAGVLVVDAALAVWQSEYDHHQGSSPGKRIIAVPYASQPNDRKHTLLVNEERVEITLPYNPKKLNGRFQPVTVDLKGVVIKATADVGMHGAIEVKMEARSTKGWRLDYAYWLPDGSGGSGSGGGSLLSTIMLGDLRKDGTVHAKGRIREADSAGYGDTYMFHLVFRTKP